MPVARSSSIGAAAMLTADAVRRVATVEKRILF